MKGLTADAADPILSLSETLGGVSGALWRPLGEPGGSLGARRVTLGGPWGVPGCLWGVLGGVWSATGRGLGVPGRPWEVVRVSRAGSEGIGRRLRNAF